MCEGKHSCPRRDCPCCRFHEKLWPRVWIGLTDDRDGVAKPLCLLRPRSVVAGMVVRKNHDFVTGFEIEAARDDIVRFARVAGNDDLLRSHTKEPREKTTGLFLPSAHLLPVVERRISIHIFRAQIHRFENGSRRWTEIRRVHHGEIRRHQELLANRHPEPFIRPLGCLCQLRWPRRQLPWQQDGATQRKEAREIATANASGRRAMRSHSTPPVRFGWAYVAGLSRSILQRVRSSAALMAARYSATSRLPPIDAV